MVMDVEVARFIGGVCAQRLIIQNNECGWLVLHNDGTKLACNASSLW
jgi:hypothetical protein